MKPLLIGLDASRATRQFRTGPENYSYEIIRALINLDTFNRYRLYTPRPPSVKWLTKGNYEWRIVTAGRLWSQARLARELKESPPDVLFVPSHVVPLLSFVPSVVTIHDVAYRYYPQQYSYLQRRYLNFSTGISIAKARRIIVPSEATKKDIVKIYKAEVRKIKVIPHGHNDKVFKPAIKKNSPLKQPYILYVGKIEAKKNIGLLLDAFTLLSKERYSVCLVLVGSVGYGYDSIRQKIQRLPQNIRQNIILPGYLPQYDLVRYYQNAALFAFPSFYEGFGLASLEAMACGLPVVASNSSAIPEVVGEAGVLLKNDQPLSWAAAFSRILHQKDYAKNLREKSIKQASKFSWESAAEKTLATIIEAANERF